MADHIALDVAYTARQLDHMLEAYPELAEDEMLRADTLDGETDLNRLMSKLVRKRQERLALAEGLDAYIADLNERKARFKRGADGLKSLMLLLMEKAQLPKMVLPEATVSVTKPRASVAVDDVNALPQGYYVPARTPVKDLIRADLERGVEVPGARLEAGSPSITVRVR